MLGSILTSGLLFAAGTTKVVSLEAGYGLIISNEDTNPGPHGLSAALYYGYMINDKTNSATVLSLVLGYNIFLAGEETSLLHAMVYGLEYAHIFFRQSKISLLLDYGLLFNQVRISGLTGYAYGHHTKLGIGAIYNLHPRHKLGLTVNYNFVAFPYFESSQSKIHFPSAALRHFFIF